MRNHGTGARRRAALLLLAAIVPWAAVLLAREKDSPTAELDVSTGRPGCTVELDAAPAGKTDAQGRLAILGVDPTDHYLHVRCPDDPQESAYFVSPRPGQKLQIRHTPPALAAVVAAPTPLAPAPSLTRDNGPDTTDGAGASTQAAPDSGLAAAEAKIKLRDLVKDAVQLRVQGKLQEAVQKLREAAELDPENSDLHRELGITFLLDKDWKRARVEMLEAIRHDPTDADAHNGLGYALEKLGDTDTALKEYRTATHLDPDDTSYRQHYFDLLSKLASQQQAKSR